MKFDWILEGELNEIRMSFRAKRKKTYRFYVCFFCVSLNNFTSSFALYLLGSLGDIYLIIVFPKTEIITENIMHITLMFYNFHVL